MRQRIIRHLSFANVASILALVMAMSAGAYALSIPRNSVGSPQIKKNGVTKSDVAKNAVTGAKVKNASLLSADFAADQLPVGPQGPAGVVGQITVEREDFTVGSSPSTSQSVDCPTGTRIIAGGASLDPSTVRGHQPDSLTSVSLDARCRRR